MKKRVHRRAVRHHGPVRHRHGKAGHALLLDTGTLGYECSTRLAPDPLVIIDSSRPRALADSKYSEQREECAAALETIRLRDPSVPNLAAALPRPGQDHRRPGAEAPGPPCRPERPGHRGRPVLRGAITGSAPFLSESTFLRDDYEVTGLELDTIAAASSTRRVAPGRG